MFSFDASSDLANTSAQTFSFSHTAGPRARSAVFLLTYDGNITQSPTYVRYGPVAMTHVVTARAPSSEIGSSHIYFANDIPTGTVTVSVRMSEESLGSNKKPVIVTLNTSRGIRLYDSGIEEGLAVVNPSVTVIANDRVFTIAALYSGLSNVNQLTEFSNSTLLYEEAMGSQGCHTNYVTEIGTGSIASGVTAAAQEAALCVASFAEIKPPTISARRDQLVHAAAAVAGGASRGLINHGLTSGLINAGLAR